MIFFFDFRKLNFILCEKMLSNVPNFYTIEFLGSFKFPLHQIQKTTQSEKKIL